MSALGLARLPNRVPVKVVLALDPPLHGLLEQYAEAYRSIYGEEAAVADLIPPMLASFLERDRAFARYRNGADKS